MCRTSMITTCASLLIATQVFAVSPENIAFTIGGGFNKFNNDTGHYRRAYYDHSYHWLYDPGNTINNGFNIYGEAIYVVNDVLSLGGGIQYIFAGSDRSSDDYITYQDDYDNRRPRVDYYHYNRAVDIVLPYFVIKNDFNISKLHLYSKLSLGVGYGVSRLLTNDIYFEATNDVYVIAMVPSLGKTIVKSNGYGVNIEAGYRFIKTSKLDEKFYINYDYNQLSFSGWFFQTGISFSL